jgi:glycosyltransferase involved in cell wall biosynthesis
MKQQDLLAAYQTFDLLLFPSMHDSSGNVALEAMASGLPVVCLDLGGPAQIVNASCGRVVPVRGLNADQVIEGLAAALTEIGRNPDIASSLRTGALERVREFSWQNVVGQVWGAHGSGYQTAIKSSAPVSDYVSA